MGLVTGYCVFGVLHMEKDIEGIVRKFNKFADKKGLPWTRIWIQTGFFGVVSSKDKISIDPEWMAAELGCAVSHCGILLAPTCTPANILPTERGCILHSQLTALSKFYEVSVT
jgi:hypothetical protein